MFCQSRQAACLRHQNFFFYSVLLIPSAACITLTVQAVRQRGGFAEVAKQLKLRSVRALPRGKLKDLDVVACALLKFSLQQQQQKQQQQQDLARQQQEQQLQHGPQKGMQQQQHQEREQLQATTADLPPSQLIPKLRALLGPSSIRFPKVGPYTLICLIFSKCLCVVSTIR